MVLMCQLILMKFVSLSYYSNRDINSLVLHFSETDTLFSPRPHTGSEVTLCELVSETSQRLPHHSAGDAFIATVYHGQKCLYTGESANAYDCVPSHEICYRLCVKRYSWGGPCLVAGSNRAC